MIDIERQESELHWFRVDYIRFLEGLCEEPSLDRLNITNQIRARYWISSIEEASMLVRNYLDGEDINGAA